MIKNCVLIPKQMRKNKKNVVLLISKIISLILAMTNKRPNRALGRSPEGKVKGHSGAI